MAFVKELGADVGPEDVVFMELLTESTYIFSEDGDYIDDCMVYCECGDEFAPDFVDAFVVSEGFFMGDGAARF
jgi:hypothetical protein